MDEIKHLDLKTIGEVEIPEELEKRLLKKIDQWANDEKKNTKAKIIFYKITAIAACISLIIGINSINNTNKAHKDTFDNPILAQMEAEKALYLLANNLEKGIIHLEKAQEITTNTGNTLNNLLNAFE